VSGSSVYENYGIPVSTVGDFKGLEADGIILVDSLNGPAMGKKELFVAVSRARSHLVLLLRPETIDKYGLF
jgi:DNA helicase IV